MNTKLSHWFVIVAVSLIAFAPRSFADAPAGPKKGPTSKIFLAETKGDTQILNNGKVYTPRQASAFDAPGTVIETKADSHDAFVYSNGTGLFVDQNSRVEINHFSQEPFQPPHVEPGDELIEPSVSQSNVLVVRGAVGICTSRLMSGSSMNYSTPQALINIRQGRVSIQTTADTTIVDLLEGDVTVRTGDKDKGGQILRPGERATVRAGGSVVVSETPKDQMKTLDGRVAIACNSRKTVAFRTVEKNADQAAGAATDDAAGAGQEIIANPTVPQNLPNNITISPDRLQGGTP